MATTTTPTTKASGLKATEDLAAVAPANILTTTTTTTTTTEAGAAPMATDEAASESTVPTPTSCKDSSNRG
ncbi:hypothetical protein VC83_04902 [Pseudogymnoascus destructans]|uniref:Uncharacterized protein n=2 Tax=Pseudogymnoascus destructans TaxID=655981 RepID=L8G376_PSED2|nr:uncharacterized protein VC83_04902 [Pseudogymnoascus destructans]ELR07088.1 hypothetical protein GMDG_08265 [Pseudogymnoascus destructans 20631-21]OAF58531.1 hypothetical protein VC83_04902 [Pseudogymnoascus destructans]